MSGNGCGGGGNHRRSDNGNEGTGNDAYGGYFKRKQQRTEEYNSNIADKQKIVGDDTNGYRLIEPTKWMEQMGMTQIKEKLKENLGQIIMGLIGSGIHNMAS
ncbi:hypothetical protein [Brevibacillus porteri]|uniref:hypothetical protein n=1 Tax=Brevibacillus porteri TaxID=2126350 RepID=UPI001FC9AD2B|nr:hypothetical protein [Brevibacillus porteri]MED1801136.1 hypothetical protein [Brevibacillus porteri]MED2131743.1 hypothetical protein [Brevibacillus porteri]MED2743483.1 hypothetical protein [Brevibacillus porteri]MED2817603.1 hypothetical protein [Brevibacillus porteri]MED2897333.1 hypothetical protein [Brevibacillus porteri]